MITRFYSVSAGHRRTCALAEDVGGNFDCGRTASSTALCWGGAFGDASEVMDEIVAVLEDISIAEVALGSEHACALTRDDRVFCWDFGSSPEPVIESYNLRSLSAGPDSTCALDELGLPVCWGERWGRPSPERVVSEHAFSVLEVNAGARFTSISLGTEHGCGFRENGLLYCWRSSGGIRIVELQ